MIIVAEELTLKGHRPLDKKLLQMVLHGLTERNDTRRWVYIYTELLRHTGIRKIGRPTKPLWDCHVPQPPWKSPNMVERSETKNLLKFG